jgi:ecotin
MTTLLLLLVIAGNPTDESLDNLKAFPPAEPGMIRFVVHVPKADAEANLKVELVVGKTVITDSVNRHFFGGQLEQETAKGWGFNYYILRQIGPMAGTLMAAPPGSPQVERFVTLGGDRQLFRYNSRLPLVVYVPDGVEVRYRIWRADPEDTAAEKG